MQFVGKEIHDLLIKELIEQNREKNGVLSLSKFQKLDQKQRFQEARNAIRQMVEEFEDKEREKIIGSNYKGGNKQTQEIEVINNDLEMQKLSYAVYLPWNEFFDIVKSLPINIFVEKQQQQQQQQQQKKSNKKQKEKKDYETQNKEDESESQQQSSEEEQEDDNNQQQQRVANRPEQVNYRPFFEMMGGYTKTIMSDETADEQSILIILTFCMKMLVINEEWAVTH
ncbi:MAG: hypothetical protein EZS28_039734, partial [Streblomastix strix]